MRIMTLATTAALAGLMVTTAIPLARAQLASPQAAAPADNGAGPPDHHHWMGGHGMDGHRMGAMHEMPGWMGHGPVGGGLLGLMYRPADRKLTPPDVQKIAEAFLLWFGNRAWKVTEVGPVADHSVKFAFATADGSVIARYTMDTRTGRVTRTG